MTWAITAVATAAAISARTSWVQQKAAQNTANYNAQVAEIEAQDARARGDREAARIRRQNAQLAGAQRATMSAKGLDISDGSAADLLDQTDFFSQIDQTTAKQNAAKEAWNLRARKQGYQAEAINARPMQSGLLAGASSVASRWEVFKN